MTRVYWGILGSAPGVGSRWSLGALDEQLVSTPPVYRLDVRESKIIGQEVAGPRILGLGLVRTGGGGAGLAMGLWGPEILGLWDPWILGSWDPGILGPVIMGSWDPKTCD